MAKAVTRGGPNAPSATWAISKRIRVDLRSSRKINYSLLHNNRELLTTLTLTKLVDDELRNIAVHVELSVGADSYPVSIYASGAERRCNSPWRRR